MVAHHLIGHGVSIHAPAGGATVPAGDSDEDFMFQSTRLREARLQEKPITQRKYPFQSTRLREARRRKRFKRPLMLRVSIHAPAGGATFDAGLTPTVIAVSIHAPAGGATCA